MASQKELRDNAQRIRERLRNNLLNSIQPGNRYAFAHGTPSAYINSMQGVPAPYKTSNGMGQTFQSGVMPNEKQISDYVESQPEYQRAVAAIKNAGSRSGQVSSKPGEYSPGYAPPQPAGPSPAMAMFNDYFGTLKGDWRAARDANLARYDEGHGELSGARDYRQQLYQNFGVAAQQDIDERLQENLKSIKADAARRGLANSNVPDAYEMRAARDTAREQQRVREMRDSRLADAYAQDTGNLVGFIERREDPYPDVNQALQLGIQLAESEANRAAQAQRAAELAQQFRGTGGRGRSDVRLPPIPGPQGGVMPMFLNGTPMQMANGYFGGGYAQPGIRSNRGVEKRSPEEYAAAKAQRKAGRNIPAPWHGRQILPTYQRPVPPLQIPYGPPQGPVYA